MTKEIAVGLVEDQFLFREGMKAIIGTWPGITIIFESADGYSVLPALQKAQKVPDVMLVDLSLPPDGDKEYSGLQVTQALTKAWPDMKILILSVHDDPHFINRLIESGAHGYLVKDSPPQEVREAIIAAYEKGTYINERALKALQQKTAGKARNPLLQTPLTRREKEILELVCRQYTAEEIAKELFISTKTVNGHRNNLLLKTGSKNATGLVLFAIRNHLITLT